MSNEQLQTAEGRAEHFRPVLEQLPESARAVLDFALVKHPFCDAGAVMARVFVGLAQRQPVEICDLYKLDDGNRQLIHGLIDEVCSSNWWGWSEVANAVNEIHGIH